MAGDTDSVAASILNWKTGQLAMPALPSLWVGLFTTAPTSDLGVTGATEVSGTGYARVQIAGNVTASSASTTIITFGAVPSWVVAGMSVRDVTTPANVPAATTVSSVTSTTVTCNNTVSGVGTDVIRFSAFTPPTASSGAEPATVAESVTTGSIITFAQAGAGGWGTVTSFGIFDAVTSGNLQTWDYLGNFKWIPFTATLASPAVITTTAADAYANGTSVVMSAKLGGTFPTVTANFAGVLTTAGLSGATFNVGVNSTASGEGLIRAVTTQPIAVNVTMTIPAGSIIISQA